MHRWTKEQIDILRENTGATYNVLSSRLRMAPQTIRRKIRELGLQKVCPYCKGRGVL